ncbi:DUF1998 domain-containing protein [Streptomonospora arabica]|uniref:DUF1998 domain-containing protein n=1 Tax=Streptomonospora arabica TaxID=412417 RepID=UPI0031E13226
MRRRPLGGVRRAQMITTYGVGSMIAIGGESFMVAGINRWPDDIHEQTINESRLEKRFGVDYFRLPPASESEKYGDVPVVRFPERHSCPECRRLADARFFGASASPAKCKNCDRELVPSRFVVCCPKGHISDFPYFEWLHKGRAAGPSSETKHELSLKAGGRSASLGDIEISCSCEVPPVTMEGALRKGALHGITACRGRRPWLVDVKDELCDESPRAMQRGSSAVWFSDVHSAISIPPWSEGVQKLVGKHWRSLRNAPDPVDRIKELELADDRRFSVEELAYAVEQRRREESGENLSSDSELKSAEYQALLRETKERSRDQDFVCVPWQDSPGLEGLAVDRVMRVKRLREVRVLQGFTRIAPPSPVAPERRSKLHPEDDPPNWLPAIEVIGEGVFLRIDEEKLLRWESRPEVVERVGVVDTAYRERFVRADQTPDRTISPRFMMIHTLAHIVLNEWSLDSGYPAASLRERLYADGGMSGFLVYTATSDSAGSLGGIVAQVESGNLGASIRAALDRASWCSADPLCMEAHTGGTDNLNRAACHACVLLPETSCEEFNTLLDRALLVGTAQQPGIGFFSL